MATRVSFEGDRGKAKEFLGKSLQELERLQARIDSVGLDRGSFHHVLDETSYCYGLILPGGLRALHVVASPGAEQPQKQPVTEETKIPDFLSGYSTDQRIMPAEGTGDKAIPQRLVHFYPSAETRSLQGKDLKYDPHNDKLSVYPWVAFDQASLGGLPFSQYGVIVPTMYTGTMRKLVQALMGFGRNDPKKKSLFDEVNKKFQVLDRDRPKTEEERRRERTQFEQDVVDNGLRVRFDYRSYRTHGLTKSADGRWWVVEIGANRGIIAMLLPMHKETQDPKFRELVQGCGRFEAHYLLDEFGGFPTGEAFPLSPNSTKAWIRAGRVLELKTSDAIGDEFYGPYTPYSSGMGWAFNLNGTEAHNTAYAYMEDGCQEGVHFAASLQIGNLVEVEPAASAEALKQLVRSVDGRDEVMEAVVWKCDRMTSEQIGDAFDEFARNKTRGFDFVDNLVLPPMAPASVAFRKVSSGRLYWPVKLNQQFVKFPEPLYGAVLSHDMRPSKILNYYPACDTTMAVFFAGNELKWIKYYLDPEKMADKNEWIVEGDSQWDIDHTMVGTFERRIKLLPNGVPALLYTSDFDDRRELAETVRTYRWKKAKLGPGRIYSWDTSLSYPNPVPYPGYGQDALCPRVPPSWALYVDVWFEFEHWFDSGINERLRSGAVIPLLDREAYYYAFGVWTRNHDLNYNYWHTARRSPNFSWSYPCYGDEIVGASSCQPTGLPEYAATEWEYQFADDAYPPGSGNAMQYPMGNYDEMQYHEQFAVSSQEFMPYKVSLRVTLVTGSAFGVIPISYEEHEGDLWSLWEPAWFQPSPDEGGDYDAIYTTHNVFGGVDSIVYETTLTGGDKKHRGAYPETMDSTLLPTYIGAPDG